MIFKKRRFKFFTRLNLHDDEIYLTLVNTVIDDADFGNIPIYRFDICLIETGEPVGRCELRVGSNDTIYYAGNIGYSVYMKFRGNRYAMKASLLLFQLAKKHSMKKLIITCNPNNIASARTCELLGCRYIETIDIPKDNIM